MTESSFLLFSSARVTVHEGFLCGPKKRKKGSRQQTQEAKAMRCNEGRLSVSVSLPPQAYYALPLLGRDLIAVFVHHYSRK